MTRIIVDPTTLSKLVEAGETAELCDGDGNTIGYFQSMKDLYQKYVPDIPIEELERSANEPGGRPLADILRDLERMGQ